MDMEHFGASPIGTLVPIEIIDGQQRWQHAAFVPDPLPNTIDLAVASWAKVTDAAAALARLDGAARRLPNPYLLVRPALANEAVATSALEGTYAALEDVLQAEFLPFDDVSASTTEVRNYIHAAELGFELITTLPICQRLAREVHGVLMSGARGDLTEVGNFRTRQNWIALRSTAPVTEALFVPPPPGDVLRRGLTEWEAWVNGTSPLPVVVRAALAHYQFETLHPFIDGNGRVGRLLIVLTFIASGELTVPLLNLSPFFEDRRDEYIDHLREVSATGDFEPWVVFFADAVRTQSERALVKADQLIDYRERLLADLRVKSVRGVALRIAEDIVSSPVVTPSRAAEKFGVTFQAANNAIARLVEEGVLREVTGRSYARLFTSPHVIDLIAS